MGITAKRWSTLSNSGQLGTCENKWESRVAVIDSVGGKNRTSWELLSNSSCLILFSTFLFVPSWFVYGWAGTDWKGGRSQQRWIGVGALLLVLSVWRALLRVRLCLYYFPGRLEELLFQKSFILFFSSSSFLVVFFNWGDGTRSRSSPFFEFLSTRKGRARNCSVIKSARARARTFIPPQFKNKSAERERKWRRIGAFAFHVAPVSWAWNGKKRRSADLFALIWKKKIARLDVWLRALHPLMREHEHGNHATVILYTQPIAEFL